MSEYEGQETLDGLIEVLTKKEHDDLRLEYERQILPKLRKERASKTCVNCGTDMEIEFHHIVPLAYGGTNNLSNIVPLCHQCHWSIHSNKHRRDVRSKALLSKAGRPRKQYSDEQIAYMLKYLECKIGKKELMKKAGLTDYRTSCNLKIKSLKNHLGIIRFKNNIDMYASHGRDSTKQYRQVGDIVGYAEYRDGTKITYRYFAEPIIERSEKDG